MLDPMTAAKDRMELDEAIDGPRPTHCACGARVSAYSLSGTCLACCRQASNDSASVSVSYPRAGAQTSRQNLELNGATMTDAKKLKAEIEETLLRNLRIAQDEAEARMFPPVYDNHTRLTIAEVQAIMRACAGNLAQILAPRLTEEPCCVLCDEPHHSVDPIAVSQNRTLAKSAA